MQIQPYLLNVIGLILVDKNVPCKGTYLEE
ncbi:MAG: hypothetical protein JWQ54_2075 [Mucilaginibacter sp.]|nr:hypothetical protein [Mucilaginibacter sp.]